MKTSEKNSDAAYPQECDNAAIRYKALFEQSPYGVLLIDTDGRMLEFNEAAHQQLGYSREEFAQLRLSDIDPVESLEEIQERISKVLRHGKADFEVTHRTKNGELRDVHVITQVLALKGQTVFHAIWRDITETKRLERSLKRKQSESEKFFSVLPMLACIASTDGYFKKLNPSWATILGYTTEELLSKPFTYFIHPDDVQATAAKVEEQKDGSLVINFINRYRCKNGTYKWLEWQTTPEKESQLIFAVANDITERKQAESEREQYYKLFQTAADIMVIADPNGAFLKTNPACTQILGYSETELVAKPFIDFVHPDDKQPTLDEMVLQLQRGFSMNFENRYLCKDGSYRLLSWRASYNKQEGKTYAVARDITEQRLAEDKLRLSERRLSESQRVARIGSWSWDVVNNTLSWSDETCRRFDTDPATFVPTVQYYVDRIHPDDRASIQQAMQDSLENDAPYHIQPRITNESGREWVLEGFGLVERDGNGKPLRFAGTAQDITERKKMEEALRSSRDFIENILNTVDEAFIVIDREFRIVRANSAYGMQVGVPVTEIAGRHCYEISHQLSRPCDESGEECAVRRCFATGKPHSCVHKHISKDGHTLYVETKSFPLKDTSGAIVSAIEVINNITDKHLLEEQMLRTQKLEAVGLLAGGIAHDFNNLLQGVFGSISMAKMSSDRAGKAYDMLEQAETALYQATSLTKQLLTFSKGGEPVKKVIALPTVIDNAVRFALSGSNIDYQPSADENLWPVQADEGQINQVVHNIVLNASEAMADGGTVRISMKNILIPETSDLPLEKGKYVRIDIRDSGMGIPDSFLSKIFDPYFTTKKKGSGLGLATSYSIIKRHGGVIMVNSQLGAGTTFSLYLPASEEGRVIEPSSERSLRSGKGRILIMDDEDIVRMVAGHMLKGLGYEAVFAENGEQALEKYAAAVNAGKPFDAVVLDLTIRGGMGGKETVKKMAELDPSVRAIVSSGYSADDILAHYEDHGFLAVLTKPYQIEELSRVLHEALDKKN